MMNHQAEVVRSLEQLAADACDGVFLVDQRGVYAYFNQACERITGYSSEDIVGSKCQCGELTECRDRHGRSLSGVLCPTRLIFDGQRHSMQQKMSLTRKDSRIIWVETIYTAVKNRANQTQLVIGVVRRLTGAESIAAASGVDWPPAQQHEGAPGDPSPIPGNELIEFTADDSTAASARSLRLDQQLERFERNVIVRALASAGGQRNRAAELMGISRSRLYRRMEALGIKPDELP